jgi:hypothetical protein
MDSPHHKLRQQNQNETVHEQQHASQGQQKIREWSSPEELLRDDAGKTNVPVTIESRLINSTRSIPGPRAPWWKRWFGS